MTNQVEQPVSPDDLVRFLKNFDQKCPVCNVGVWRVYATDKCFMLPVRDQGGLRMKLLGMPCYSVVCETCGYIRTHATEVVDEWVRSNPESADV